MLNTLLLSIVAIFSVFYAVNALKPDSKKSFFKREMTRVKKQIWDTEFKIEKTLQIREGIRRDRDGLVDQRHKLEAAFKATPNDKQIEADLKEVNDTISRYERQMKMLDNQIQGVPAEGEDPGENGLNDTIASLSELKMMYEQYIAKL